MRAFDPQTLKHIAEELGQQIPRMSRAGAASELAWLKVGNNNATCGYRLHAQFKILRDLPSRIDATSGKPKGACDESEPCWRGRSRARQPHVGLIDK